MERKDYKEYPHTAFWKEDEDIIFFNYRPNIEIDLDMAKELIRNRLEYSEGKSMYTLIDFTNVKSVTKEARDYMNSPEGGLKGILGGAFLSNSIVSNVFINLYLRISKPSVPAKFFAHKEEALNWLRGLKNKH